MNIGIIDADLLDKGTQFPNLALLKLSGYHKAQGDSVSLLTDYTDISSYDSVYIAKVFSKTSVPDDILTLPNVNLGGTGFFDISSPKLSYNIEHHMPDYTLYQDYIQTLPQYKKSPSSYSGYFHASIGFTSRGCFRKCPFCVNRVYDKSTIHSPVSEFFDPSKKHTILLDDNILACPDWRSILESLKDTKKPFTYIQGLDIRLLNKEKATLLSNCKYKGDFIFAFDNIQDRDCIEPKLRLWRDTTYKNTKVYVICGFYSQDVNDVVSLLERIKILR